MNFERILPALDVDNVVVHATTGLVCAMAGYRIRPGLLPTNACLVSSQNFAGVGGEFVGGEFCGTLRDKTKRGYPRVLRVLTEVNCPGCLVLLDQAQEGRINQRLWKAWRAWGFV